MSGPRRQDGQLAPFVRGYRGRLLEASYTPQTTRGMVMVLGQLGRWMGTAGVEVGALDTAAIEAFLPSRRAGGHRVPTVRAPRSTLVYLREVGAMVPEEPSGIRYGRVQALRQTLEAAIRWGYMTKNSAVLAGRNRQPAPRPIRAFTRVELDAIVTELSPAHAPLPTFAAATGLRPEEWQALERRYIDRGAGCSPCGARSRRDR